MGLALVVGIVIAGFVVVNHLEGRVRRQLDDVALCGRKGASLFAELSVQPTAGPGSSVALQVLEMRVSRTDAASAAREFEIGGLSQHPWDEIPPDTSVLRCQSGSLRWLVDREGHATRLPGA